MTLFFPLLLKLNFIFMPSLPAQAEEATRARFLMGTLLSISAPAGHDDAVSRAFAFIAETEAWMSTYKEDSELSRLNSGAGAGPVLVSDPLWDLLQASETVWRQSRGAFDPTYASPAPARGFGKIKLDPAAKTAALPEGSRLDFGGIGKGWALDGAARLLREAGVPSATLDFGGQILVFSSPLRRKSRLVEIVDPVCRRAALSMGRTISCGSPARLHLVSGSVATSGTAERPGHLIDPATGDAARVAGRSVSVAAPTAAAADAWSTALLIGGAERLPTQASLCALEVERETVLWHGDCSPYRNNNTRRKS